MNRERGGDNISLLVLVFSSVLIVIVSAMIIVGEVRGHFKNRWGEADSLDRRAIPMEIRGSKYPSLRLKLLDDSLEEECSVRVGRKLYDGDDTLNVRIYLNSSGERIHAKIIDEDVEN